MNICETKKEKKPTKFEVKGHVYQLTCKDSKYNKNYYIYAIYHGYINLKTGLNRTLDSSDKMTDVTDKVCLQINES